MIDAFVQGLDDTLAAEISTATMPYRYDRDQVAALLINRFEQRLRGAFTLRYEDLVAETSAKERDALIGLLRGRALRFGEVKKLALEHLHLDNPVRIRPFIELDPQTFFCPAPQTLGVHMSEILEHLCAISPSLKKKSERARADLLEEQLADVVRRFLPSAELREKVKWSEDGGITTWESDLVAVIDKTVLVFEATLSAHMQRTDFWADMLVALEKKREVGWTRLGHRLLNADVRVQRRVERLYKKGMQAVTRDPGKFFTSGVTVGSSYRLDTISVSVGAPDSPEQFDANLNYAARSAFEQGGQDSLLALYWFVPRSGEAYDFIGVMRRQRTARGFAGEFRQNAGLRN